MQGINRGLYDWLSFEAANIECRPCETGMHLLFILRSTHTTEAQLLQPYLEKWLCLPSGLTYGCRERE
jgi:hypothetical protein